MTYQHPQFKLPEDRSTPIWRYMDFTKFVALLESSELYFSRADLMGDPFEGSYPNANIKRRLATSIPHDPEIQRIYGIRDEESNQKFSVQWTFVNCWHMNHHESAAMWRLYSQSSEAIAIKSSIEKLDSLLDDQTYFGVVSYVDYDSVEIDSSNYFSTVLNKRASYAHENEVRAIKWTPPTNHQGIFDFDVPLHNGLVHKVDLEKLLTEICISPNSPLWFMRLVEKLTARYAINVPVVKSQLDKRPLF